MSPVSKRFVELDAFRGIAVLLVAVFHYFYRYDQIYSHDGLATQWTVLGSSGVDLFFIVSGFVILWSISGSASPKHFCFNRFFRLYPTYWVCLTFTFAAVSLLGLPGRESDILTFIFNFTMLQGFVDRFSAVDGVYWSLKVELLFYLWLVVLAALNGLKYLSIISLIVLSLNIISMGFDTSQLSIINLLQTLFFHEYIHLFIYGMSMFRVWKGTHTRLDYVNMGLAVVLNLLLADPAQSLLILFFYIGFFLAIKGKMNFICIKPLLFLGAISYPFYLLHQNIGYALILQLKILTQSSLLAIIITFAVTLTLSWLVHLLVEKRLTSSIKNWAFSHPALGLNK